MCGINGIFQFTSANFDIKDAVVSMNNVLEHREPDHSGVWVEEHSSRLALGQTRLSILDLSDAGHQPMHETSTKNKIVYNGVKDNIAKFNKETNLFNLDEVNAQLRLLKDGNEQYTNSIWTMYFLINWCKKWF